MFKLPIQRSLLIRLFLFTSLFLLISGWYGSWIISTPLHYPFYYFIYGNLGKMLLFSFIFIARKRLKEINIKEYNRKNLIIIFLTVFFSPLFFPVAGALLNYESFTTNLPLSLFAHSFIILVPLFLALGIYGLSFLKKFI